MLPLPKRRLIGTHWGTYEVVASASGPALRAWKDDPDPSPIARSMVDARTSPARILRPAVRRSFLEHGHRSTGAGRGHGPFVEVDWDVALDLAAREIDRVRKEHGNSAIFGGSYGWASAGRFHHAQSQVHRFLNVAGGYTRSVQNYSFAAGEVLLPHIIGNQRGLSSHHTTWDSIVENTELLVLFGGAPLKNAQVSSGGISRHGVREALLGAKARGCRFVSVSPLRDDVLEDVDPLTLWIRPNTDVALMLAVAYVLLEENRYDRAFLDRYTFGFDEFACYVKGESDGIPKSPEWAAVITEVPAADIVALARDMASRRTMISVAWSLQRAEHGEQPYWMAITLAAMLGGIGLPGQGFGFGYAAVNGIGNPTLSIQWPSLPQGTNPVPDFIPVSRLTDMLLHPGETYHYNGQVLRYPDTRLIYWAGGNPFHHQQDLNRLCRAWQKPEVVIVNELWWNALARRADIVLPVTSPLERNDIVCSGRDRMLAANHRMFDPAGEARNDFDIFTGMAERLGIAESFTEGLDEEGWLRRLYQETRERVAAIDVEMPEFDRFWAEGIFMLPRNAGRDPVLMAAFRQDPAANPLGTETGRIQIVSPRIGSFGYEDCPAHPKWLAPTEWSEASPTSLHLISNQPYDKLHSQYDCGSHSQAAKLARRQPLRMHPDDAAKRDLADGNLVRLYNRRGSCLATLQICDAVRPGAVQMATGSWFDPEDPTVIGSLDKHGNPNVLTRDLGASQLSQACSAQTCLVEVEKFIGPAPDLTCFLPPAFIAEAS